MRMEQCYLVLLFLRPRMMVMINSVLSTLLTLDMMVAVDLGIRKPKSPNKMINLYLSTHITMEKLSR